MEKKWLFDSAFTQEYTKIRQAFTGEFLASVRESVDLKSALDVGCGVGYFSKFLADTGFEVVAVDGREENLTEGRRRNPDITFLSKNVEDPALPDLGSFDFVLCVGLLYHLENPFRAVRNLHALTAKVLMLESMCVPGEESNLQLLDESPGEDQGLNYVAFYPTEACLVKMLYRAGFPFVYRFNQLPADEQFTTTLWRKRSRTFLAASNVALTLPNLALAQEPIRAVPSISDPWTTNLSRARHFLSSKVSSLRVIAGQLRSRMPVPVRLSFGAWWIARNDHIGRPIREGRFEVAEVAFVRKFLQPGMTVLDIGAHHGFYTLLASKCVGRNGRVVAFEPSSRERKALRLHLKLNRCKNVEVQELALGEEPGKADLHVVDDWAAGCNSLRPPDVAAGTTPVPVSIVRLGDWLADNRIERVDFIKLDVEGGELAVLKGASELLKRPARPIILAEVQDIRTRPWGYGAKEIIEFLRAREYRWFQISDNGSLVELNLNSQVFDGNFVAAPDERMRQVAELAKAESRP